MSVAVADVFLKKASTFTDLATFLKSPWMIGAISLYIFQIFIFIYLFFTGMKLIDVGIMQVILYALIVLASGILFFHETLTLIKIIGIILGIISIALISL
ncbi:hypothetical protein A3I84_01470 [Candidatus Nomurabacteria bacterium RIFCSPLOWO2_02_FULL_36_8]|nr:MAG: hypothetical protein A3I84_01470 [Candidatus Nomurabacteria bacterium RIFCSPLOWO2_02_FULL_36_8]